MSVLSRVKLPKDLKKLSFSELQKLNDELRDYTIEIVSRTGGHLGASLGVVELTVALHYVFNAPSDKIIWDVGHQTYPHKILTGRKNKIHSLRKKNGISGFTKRSESVYDPFGAAHSSTSISAGLGITAARDLLNKNFDVVSIIGDGAISAGMAFEGLNNLGHLNKNSLIIRLCMTEKPFIHKGAYANMITNFIFHDDFIKIFKKILNKRGVLNIGGKTMSVYKFAKRYIFSSSSIAKT